MEEESKIECHVTFIFIQHSEDFPKYFALDSAPHYKNIIKK